MIRKELVKKKERNVYMIFKYCFYNDDNGAIIYLGSRIISKILGIFYYLYFEIYIGYGRRKFY